MSRVKAAERRLIGEYRNLLESVFGALADRHDLALDLARAPQLVRGYGDIKLDSIAAYRAEVERIVSMLAAPSTDPTRDDRESRANAINRAA
jgi:indolepyruvate ferredoxin oxidoreductase